jgi:hypothetical protein
MPSLSYRVWKNGPRWYWEIFDATRNLLASGEAETSVEARVDALLAGLPWITQRRPEDLDPTSIRH